jgi:hypothetical protein
MKAMLIDRFGGPEELRLGDTPIPEIGPWDVRGALIGFSRRKCHANGNWLADITLGVRDVRRRCVF